MKKTTLVIVDFQVDFARNTGSLYVPRAEQAERGIIEYIVKNTDNIDQIIFTVDEHYPAMEFGEWPVHCLKHSEGAGITRPLMDTVIDSKIPYKVFVKGEGPIHNEYGAFHHITRQENGDIVANNMTLSSFVNLGQPDEIVVCGLAGDYCVHDTYLQLCKVKDVDVVVYMGGVASLDGGDKITGAVLKKINERNTK